MTFNRRVVLSTAVTAAVLALVALARPWTEFRAPAAPVSRETLQPAQDVKVEARLHRQQLTDRLTQRLAMVRQEADELGEEIARQRRVADLLRQRGEPADARAAEARADRLQSRQAATLLDLEAICRALERLEQAEANDSSTEPPRPSLESLLHEARLAAGTTGLPDDAYDGVAVDETSERD